MVGCRQSVSREPCKWQSRGTGRSMDECSSRPACRKCNLLAETAMAMEQHAAAAQGLCKSSLEKLHKWATSTGAMAIIYTMLEVVTFSFDGCDQCSGITARCVLQIICFGLHQFLLHLHWWTDSPFNSGRGPLNQKLSSNSSNVRTLMSFYWLISVRWLLPQALQVL